MSSNEIVLTVFLCCIFFLCAVLVGYFVVAKNSKNTKDDVAMKGYKREVWARNKAVFLPLVSICAVGVLVSAPVFMVLSLNVSKENLIDSQLIVIRDSKNISTSSKDLGQVSTGMSISQGIVISFELNISSWYTISIKSDENSASSS